MSYDQKCYDLAVAWLPTPIRPGIGAEYADLHDRLAQAIQDAIEDWMLHERGLDQSEGVTDAD